MRNSFFLAVTLWFVFLLPFTNYAIESIVKTSSSPFQSPVVPPHRTAGAIDSLQIVKKLVNEKEYQKALKVALPLLDRASLQKDKNLIYKTNEVIAQIFYKSNNFEKALEYYRANQKYQFTSRLKDVEKTTRIYDDIGNVFYQLEEFDSAQYYYTKAINITDNSPEIEILKAKAYSNLASIQILDNKFHIAEQNIDKAIKIHQKYNDVNSITSTLNSLGSIYLRKGEFDKAKSTFTNAINILEKDSTKKFFTVKEALYDNLAYTLFLLKDYNAYDYQEKSFTIRDSIRDAEVLQILAEIEGKFNTESIKKQAQITAAEEKAKLKHAHDISIILGLISASILLGSWLVYRYLRLRQEKLKLELDQNQLLQQTELDRVQNEAKEKILNAALDGKESERKMIAETLHHSVSSLLSSASLHLQASKMMMKGKQPEEIEKAHTIINEAAEKIRNLSHSLVSSVLLKFGLKYAIQDLCEKYSNSKLIFSCDCKDLKRYSPDFELRINSIIEELLNNVIKHSFASKCEINLIEENHHLEITIDDNGKGFNTKTYQEKSGFGLKQIESRIKKMNGIFKINSTPTKGTKIYIYVPVQEDITENL